MNLTPKIKSQIDSLSLEALLSRWRNAPIGDAMFQGESGKYWGERLASKRNEQPSGFVAASKSIGWEG